jgi:hypothetical protein
MPDLVKSLCEQQPRDPKSQQNLPESMPDYVNHADMGWPRLWQHCHFFADGRDKQEISRPDASQPHPALPKTPKST